MSIRLLILATAAAALSLPAAAQTSPAKKPAPKRAATKKAEPPKPAPPVLLPANDEQLAAAKLAHLGVYDCEFNQTIQLIPHPQATGYIEVAWKKDVYVMKPVLSSTGALRLEDVTGRTLMIQIANKSMLMDTKIGQRLVDECIHPMQRAAIEAMKANPAPPGSSLGIDPAKAAAVAAATTAASAAVTAASAAQLAASAAQTAASAAMSVAAAASAPAAPAATPAAVPASAPAAAPASAASAPR
jgi:hypothetical protein